MRRTRQTHRGTHGLLMIFSVLLVHPCLAQQAQEPERLDPVVVTATRAELPLSHVGSAVTVITAEELEQQQIRIVSDVLREVPGVAVNRTGAVGQFTQLRICWPPTSHALRSCVARRASSMVPT
jgi:vitamin B12 transporter